MHAAAQRIAGLLQGLGANGAVIEVAESARTSAEAAAALGCPVGAIAKSLVFVADGEPILVLASGAHQVDLAVLGPRIDRQELRRATPEEVRQATGQPIGGVAPLGHPRPLPAFIDTALRAHERIWAAAGTPRAVFPTDFVELARLAAANEVTVA
ncbi:MAG: YbaK/EbsC family protein [Actinomycetota bacterium]|nr:YbaK/EbsC family protein [Actinomycetota bacterium]